MNVSLSRARLGLIVVGNAKRLMIKGIWKKLVEFSVKEGCCFRAEEGEEFWGRVQEARVMSMEEFGKRRKK
jgi:superfamily I DNA and/or RNA helicase